MSGDVSDVSGDVSRYLLDTLLLLAELVLLEAELVNKSTEHLLCLIIRERLAGGDNQAQTL